MVDAILSMVEIALRRGDSRVDFPGERLPGALGSCPRELAEALALG